MLSAPLRQNIPKFDGDLLSIAENLYVEFESILYAQVQTLFDNTAIKMAQKLLLMSPPPFPTDYSELNWNPLTTAKTYI